jgi:hypothetical protein
MFEQFRVVEDGTVILGKVIDLLFKVGDMLVSLLSLTLTKELPAAGPETVRAVYVFSGETLLVADTNVRNRQAAVCAAGVPLALTAGSKPTEVLVLQGRPIGEPVAQYGPFVMNTEAEIEETFADYRQTQFGGWPWEKPDPTHGGEATRFAKHSSGQIETPDVESAPST